MHWDNFGWQFWHWWHGWRWYFGTYQWLELNNLWKASLAFFVTLFLGIAITACMRPWRTWKHHREVQEKIADRLDTSTPGGMADVLNALRRVLNELDEGEAPDDNGSDLDSTRKPRGGHHIGVESSERIVPRGGGSAGHR